jgi:hypothetical protein
MATLDDQTKAAFTSASDWSKQILTLSTGIVTLTISFSDKIFGDLSDTEKWFLWIAWGLYVVSIVGGVWLLSALTGTLAKATAPTAASVYDTNTRVAAIAQVVCFVLATISIVVFGFSAVGNKDKQEPAKTTTGVAQVL